MKRFTCPLTGEAFSQAVGYSTFPLVTFPDGSYPGDEQVNTQVPVCPADGLVLLPDFSPPEGDEPITDTLPYARYTKTELAKLPMLVADPAYAALKADGRYAQAYWIATQLGRPAFDRFSMLQRATWSTAVPAQRRKLVERLVSEGPALIEAADKPASYKRYLRALIANALRELGRFDEARALAVQIGADAAKAFDSDNPDEMINSDPGTAELIAVIDAHDTDRYPVGLMPSKWANAVCNGQTMRAPYTLTETGKTACEKRKADAAQKARDDAKADAELTRLRGNPEERDRLCAATPEGQRSAGLARACEVAQRAIDEQAADEMEKDGEKVAALCESTPETSQKGAIFFACISYGVVLESELGQLVADDEAAFAILCPEGDRESVYVPGRQRHVSSACNRAQQIRAERKEETLLADPMALDAECARVPENKRTGSLIGACIEREAQIRTADIERTATVPAEFERVCGGFARTNSAGNATFGLTEAQEKCRNAWRLRENNRVREDARGKGLSCFNDAIYSPDRPRCVSKAEYDRAMQPSGQPEKWPDVDNSSLSEGSSLSLAARARAASLIAKAKADGAFPKKRPGDRD